MQLTTTVDDLRTVFETTEPLLEDQSIKTNKDGIRLVAADPAMVSMVDITIDADYFDSYEVEDDIEPIGVNLNKLTTLLKKLDKDAKLDVSVTDSHFVLKTEHGEFTLPLLDLDDNVPDTGNLEFEIAVDVTVDELKDTFNLMSVYGNSMSFEYSDGIFEANAEDKNSHASNEVDVDVVEDSDQNIVSMFSLDYLKKTRKAVDSIADTVSVRLADDYPIKVVIDEKNITGKIVIAPRIEE